VLPAHVLVESYSVLTRLPGGLAVPPATAASALARRFPEPPLRLSEGDRAGLIERLAGASVFAGASYDGLIALEAHTNGQTLRTLDERAQATYRRLGVAFEAIG
jgi:toxin FitB